MTDDRIWFGRPGALTSIWHPKGVFTADRERLIDRFGLGNGGQRIDQMVGGARTYTITYEGLTRNAFATLQAYADGLEGPGPFVLLDPGQRNMLPSNIAGATSVTNGVEGAGTGDFEVESLFDDFNRAPVVSGWGTAPSGQAWTTTNAANHAVANGAGSQVQGSVGAFRTAVAETGSIDFDITVTTWVDTATPTGAGFGHWVCPRYIDGSNHMVFRLLVTTGGDLQLVITYRSGGSLAGSLAIGTVGTGHAANERWTIHVTGVGANFTASAWRTDTETEPDTPDLTATDSTITTGTQLGLLSRLETSNTNPLPVTMYWSDLDLTPRGALSSSDTYTDAGPRVLAYTHTAVGSADVRVGWPSSTFRHGVPVAAGRPVCFSAWLRGGGTDAITTWQPRIVWKNAAGVVVGITTTGSGAVATSSGAWAQAYATGTPPADAVYADVDVMYTSGASAGSITYFRRFMLNEGSTPDTTWVPGTGVWPVKVLDLPERWIGRWPEFRTDPAFSVAEDTS